MNASRSHSRPARQRGLTLIATMLLIAALGIVAYVGLRVLRTDQPAPAVSYPLIDGARLAQQDLRGKVVLVNFWATSCVTCVKEMPTLVETHEKFAPRGYETIAVAMSYDRPDYVLNFAKTRGLPFRVALDLQGEVARGFGDIAVTPTSFLIDRQGNIAHRWVGEPPAKFHAWIEDALKG